QGAADTDPSLIPPNVDDTMELPIFREVESAWFRTKQPARPSPRPDAARATAAPPAGTDAGRATKTLPPVQRAGATAAASAGENDSVAPPAPAPAPVAAPAPAPAEAGQSAWASAADDGWRAASAAADVAATDTTGKGLPKRVPMAQLVPGGVETQPAGARNRSPDAVRGLLSAYHRGVQRGRQSSAGKGTDEDPGKEQA
ncbi:MAG: hypothetical protein ACRDT6_26700, partial [Micromonosporaceae bacterium]